MLGRADGHSLRHMRTRQGSRSSAGAKVAEHTAAPAATSEAPGTLSDLRVVWDTPTLSADERAEIEAVLTQVLTEALLEVVERPGTSAPLAARSDPREASRRNGAGKRTAAGRDEHQEVAVRLDYAHVLPETGKAMLALERVVQQSTLEPRLVELVKLRVSQINGCARCTEMHTKDARALGEDQDRLDLVAVWPETPCFSPAERAALAWGEALTTIADSRAPDDTYEELARHFDAQEVVALTLAVAAINAWNRLNVGLRIPAGGYVSRLTKAAGVAIQPA